MNWRRRKWILGTTAASLLALLAVAAWHCLAAWDLPTECVTVRRLPRIRPDYTETVIPPNIAPLNFVVEEPAIEYRVHIYGTAGKDIVVGSRSRGIVIPLRPWRQLLSQNRGAKIMMDVYARDKDGRWSRFDAIANDVAREDIDSHLVYRLLGPICNYYHNMGIHQRNLENHDQSPILTTELVNACFNCHSFVKNRPDTFSFQVRPGGEGKEVASGMVMVCGGRALRPKTDSKAAPIPPAYTSWHPAGSVAAFSMIRPVQCFHGAGLEIREVFDSDSHLAAVNTQTGIVSTSPGIADPARMETFPGWSADGKTLYFASAKRLWDRNQPIAIGAVDKLKYDLMCVRYDVEKDVWGQPKMILSSAKTGMSISQPRASPDGRYLLFCMADYGTFVIHRSSCDLYLMDLKTRKYRRMECNSPESDSWHCWSSNSRWIVFSSRRDTGWLARPYFCYIDAQGREHKPFLLPQKDPKFYDTCLNNYNVPELVTGPVTIPEKELLQAVRMTDSAADRSQKPVPVGENPYPSN
jgi:hypothetical protein